jgi:hypothetical protein
MLTHRHLVLPLAMATMLLACHHAPAPASPTAASANDQALSGIAAQNVVLLPTYTVRVAPDLPWGPSIGRTRGVQQALDSAIRTALDDRGVGKTWIYPEQLVASYKRNITYATDPYLLAEEPLRSPALQIAQRLAEPFASQIRTMVALHGDARLVLAPVELRFEKAGVSAGRATLRVVLADARGSNIQWIGKVESDTASSYSPAMIATIAARFGDMMGEKR